MLKAIFSFVLIIMLFSHTLAVRADTAIFAGGCFWCVEALYQEVEGVTGAVSGFTGGILKNPTYSGNHRGHYEAVKVTYNPEIVTYEELLVLFWVNIDPFNNKGQFCDRGPSYRSAIFTSDEEELKLASEGKEKIKAKFKLDVYTEILKTSRFYPVERGHQDYYLKNPFRYKIYRQGCGRDKRLKEIWGSAAKR
ncbi:MAG: peptide-methionine (S)-S-oxide reductase MsrA [Pseudomonadales bacterium]|nr:peptide-methionine (S)-S-oxide reductase MsrA [Pseudomonadales bacterium]